MSSDKHVKVLDVVSDATVDVSSGDEVVDAGYTADDDTKIDDVTPKVDGHDV